MIKHIASAIILGNVAVVNASSAGSVEPERYRELLREQPNETYSFVVTVDSPTIIDRVLETHKDAIKEPTKLKLLNGFVAKLPVRHAFKISDEEGVDTVWYFNPDEAEISKNVLKSLDYSFANGALFNSLSIGPPRRFFVTRSEPDAPVQRMLTEVARSGRLSIVAIGNEGERAPGYVNPWSAISSVISVGAWDYRTQSVWRHSSSGNPDDPETWPDVVADGVDVVGPMTGEREKTKSEKEYDETNKRFTDVIKREEWDLYTLKSGTSMAVVEVREAAAQIFYFLQNIIAEKRTSQGSPLFSITVGPNNRNGYDDAFERINGTARLLDGGAIEYTYLHASPFDLVKQILIDIASPVADSPPWKSGAGLISLKAVREQFGKYGSAPSKIMGIKVTKG